METPSTAFSLASLSTLPMFETREAQLAHNDVVAASEREAIALGFVFKRSALAALVRFTEARPNATAAELLNALQVEVERGALPPTSAVVLDKLGALTNEDVLYVAGAMAQLQGAGVRLILGGKLVDRPVDVEQVLALVPGAQQ